jgi:uncharacterized integral membrane protein
MNAGERLRRPAPSANGRATMPSEADHSAPATEPVEPRMSRLRRRGHHGVLYGSALAAIALMIVLIALVVANTRQVPLSWVVGSGSASLVWILLATAVVGWLLGIATAVVFRYRTRRIR